MRCPYCRADETRVTDSRESEGGTSIRRRRECQACEKRFTTFERTEDVGPVLTKRDGSSEPFDRAKVISGIGKACANLAVPDEVMLGLTDAVEEELRSQTTKVSTQDVGREVLVRLQEVDPVAYLRFASVYKGFSEVSEFQAEIAALEKSSPPKTRRKKRVGTVR